MSNKHCSKQVLDCSQCPTPEPEPTPDCEGCGNHLAINTLDLMLAIRAFEEHVNLTDAMAWFKTITCLAHQNDFLDPFVGNSTTCDDDPHDCLIDEDCNPCPFANETFVCTNGLCASNTTEPIIP